VRVLCGSPVEALPSGGGCPAGPSPLCGSPAGPLRLGAPLWDPPLLSLTDSHNPRQLCLSRAHHHGALSHTNHPPLYCQMAVGLDFAPLDGLTKFFLFAGSQVAGTVVSLTAGEVYLKSTAKSRIDAKAI